MLILVTDRPSNNGYIRSLINAYKHEGHTVVCDVNNFFDSNINPDVVHIHWPERLDQWYGLRSSDNRSHLRLIRDRLQAFKYAGSIIVHTVHNLCPHAELSREPVSDEAYKLIISESDILVHHCGKSVEMIAHLYPEAKGKKQIICRHGPYLDDFKKIDSSIAKARLGINNNSFVMLNFGVQRPYKNERFVHDVYSLVDIPEKLLFVAGKFEYPSNFFVRAVYKCRNWFRSRWAFGGRRYAYENISSELLPFLISAADIIFLGHRRGLNSGILALAATYGKVAVYPNIGCFEEAVEECYSEKYEVSNKHSAKQAVERAHENVRAGVSLDNSDWLESVSWRSHVCRIIDAVSEARAPVPEGSGVVN